MKNRVHRHHRIKGIAALFLILCAAVLILFRVSISNARAEENLPEARYKYYTSIQIHSGDSLWSIAETYMTGEYQNIYDYIDEVREINHLSGDYLRAGSKLCVPYYSSEYKR